MHSLKNTHNHKKNLVKMLQKNFKKKSKKSSKKKFKKKFQKKIEERLPRFSRSPIGGGEGRGLYICVMVVAYLYAYIDKQTDGIDRHKDREQRAESRNAKIHLTCLLVWIG